MLATNVDMNERYLGTHPEAQETNSPPLMYAKEREALRKAVMDDRLEVYYFGDRKFDRVTYVEIGDTPSTMRAVLNGTEKYARCEQRAILLWNVFPNKFQIITRKPLIEGLD